MNFKGESKKQKKLKVLYYITVKRNDQNARAKGELQ